VYFIHFAAKALTCSFHNVSAMFITFRLKFSTQFGQTIFVSGSTPVLGSGNVAKAWPLAYVNNQYWQLTIKVNEDERINYKYILREPGKPDTIEFGNDRVIEPTILNAKEVLLVDTWNFTGDTVNAFYTQPFTQVLLKHKNSFAKSIIVKNFTHEFRVKSPLLNTNEVICIAGSGNTLNNWDTEKPLLLQKKDNWYTTTLRLTKNDFPLNYKYGVYNTQTKAFVQFENGDNRVITEFADNNAVTICHDGFVNIPFKQWKGAGVAIPVFSLRSKNSFGTGEFTDLKLMVDWAKKTGLKLIQLLPLNDTSATHTWKDSYPYSAISAFALHPIYLNLSAVAGKAQAAIVKPLHKKQQQLNALPHLDYDSVIKFKTNAIKEIFLAQKDTFLNDEDYQLFFKQNKHWLLPYAAFCYLRDKYSNCQFTTWKSNSVYNEEAIQRLVSPSQKHFDEVAVHYFAQYHLHVQLKEATAYAHKNGVVVKGDIPIGIYRDSVDAWVAPDLYNMNAQAGAPPDDFAVKGQNWGFPTYNWKAMQQDGFMWWRKRFEQMSNYFDAFRIDHILGFFRIWSIPLHAVEGIMGKFDPAIPVHINELFERNISFDWHRYCKPYITDSVLYEFFGNNADYVRHTFLNDHYELTEAFNTQRKVEAYFASQQNSDEDIKLGLYNLISNVILFEDAKEPGNNYHFRFGMEQTPSFKALDAHSQQQLRELYVNYFFRKQDNFWQAEAMQKLPALKYSTNMLICGEDLGLVPACVPDVMWQLGILSLEIQRMPKKAETEFFHPNDAPYMSVITPSTHDMSTIRGWWEENRSNTQKFYNNIMGRYGEAPYFCEAWINKEIVLQHLYSPAMWSIFQLQDWMGSDEKIRRSNPADERINIPADPNHYWRYRMHITLEELLSSDEFNDSIRENVAASGR
jgi:4-alpha-glucanotransferase